MANHDQSDPAAPGLGPARGGDKWPLLLTGGAFLLQMIGLYWPKVPSTGSTLPLDKVAHVLMFAVVTGLAVWAGLAWQLVVAVMVAQAGISELVQGAMLASRGGDWADFVADLVGVAIGLVVAWNLPERWRPRPGPAG